MGKEREYWGGSENIREGEKILGSKREYWGRSENIWEVARILGREREYRGGNENIRRGKNALIIGKSRQSTNNKWLECCV